MVPHLLLPEKMGGFSLFKYILRRIGAMLLTLFLIMTLSFWIIRLMPMSIFENPNIPPDIQKLLMSEMHLDKPMLLQYYYFLEGIILEGEFGTSVKVRPRMDVFEILSSRIPPTVQLNFLSLLISLPLGVIFGTIAALRRNQGGGQHHFFPDCHLHLRAVLCVRLVAAILFYVPMADFSHAI